ncbi:MAG TPA: glycosyl transferase [Rhodospirillaceae bacterium]|nr:glycosyl transferase [Rhodospirillaceae bacterium]
MSTALFLTYFFALAFGALLTYTVRKKLLARAIMDIPNDRSMHKEPVPRGGGLAIMGVVAAGLLLFSPVAFDGTLADPLNFHWAMPRVSSLILLLSICLLVSVSWLDDKRPLSPALRLAVHLLAAFVGSFALPDTFLLFGGLLPAALDRIAMVLGWAWFMNIYNFMDGIDGLTGVQTVAVVTGVAALFWGLEIFQPSALHHDLLLCALVAGATGGFLAFNWPPAKIFMGDVGSIPLGFLIGYLLLKLASLGFLAAAIILPLYYLADSAITMGRRALKREKIWQAHRQHFYQRATLGEGRPKPVVIKILIADFLLFGAALLSMTNPWLGLGLGVMIVILLLLSLSLSAKKAKKI